ncbi:MAG: QueT transporter family protein [Bacilli bacterium]|nr:QueT transporter family protein [Bacilli bacterium]
MAHNESKPSGGFFSVRMIAENSIIAALYVALTLLVPVLSFGPIQCRFSEALVLLCFWRPDITIGLTIGCLISNGIGAALGVNFAIDILFGTLATLLSCLLISFFSKRLFIAWIWPVLFNAFIVGTELYLLEVMSELALWQNWLYVGIGETIALAAGYVLWVVLAHLKIFNKVFEPTRHQDVKW